MKKIFLFFAIFFFCSVLSAEEAAADSKEKQEQAGNVCPCNEYKTVKEPKKVYFSLFLEVDHFMVPFLGTDVGFLVKHTERGNNIYLGLGTGLKYFLVLTPYGFNEVSYHGELYHNVFGLPFQGHIAFDFKRKDCFLDYISLRLFGGIELLFGQSVKYNEEKHRSYLAYDGLSGFVPFAGIGLDFVFNVNVVLRAGFLFENREWLGPLIGVGYRF